MTQISTCASKVMVCIILNVITGKGVISGKGSSICIHRNAQLIDLHLNCEKLIEINADQTNLLISCSDTCGHATPSFHNKDRIHGIFQMRCNGNFNCSLTQQEIQQLYIETQCKNKIFVEMHSYCSPTLNDMCNFTKNVPLEMLLYSPQFPERMKDGQWECECTFTTPILYRVFTVYAELVNFYVLNDTISYDSLQFTWHNSSTSTLANSTFNDRHYLGNLSQIKLNVQKLGTHIPHGKLIILLRKFHESAVTHVTCMRNDVLATVDPIYTTKSDGSIEDGDDDASTTGNTPSTVAIVAGSAAGAFVVLVLLTVCIVCLIRKRGTNNQKDYVATTESNENTESLDVRHTENVIVDMANGKAQYSVVRKSDQRENTTPTEKETYFDHIDSNENIAPHVPEKTTQSREGLELSKLQNDVGKENNMAEEGLLSEHSRNNSDDSFHEENNVVGNISINPESGDFPNSYDTALPAFTSQTPTTLQTNINSYDEALPANYKSDNPDSSANVEIAPNGHVYNLYDKQYNASKHEHTNTGNSVTGSEFSTTGDSGDTIVMPKNPDYAYSYMKTKGSDIRDRPQNKTDYSYAEFSDINNDNKPMPYSYADNRGKVIAGITKHIVGEGYSCEKPLPGISASSEAQTPLDNTGPYSYAGFNEIKRESVKNKPNEYSYTGGNEKDNSGANSESEKAPDKSSVNPDLPIPAIGGHEYQDIDGEINPVNNPVREKNDLKPTLGATGGDYQDIDAKVMPTVKPKPGKGTNDKDQKHKHAGTTGGEYQYIDAELKTKPRPKKESSPKRESGNAYQEIAFIEQNPPPEKKFTKDGVELMENDVYQNS